MIKKIFLGIFYFPYAVWFFLRALLILRLKKKNPKKFEKKWPLIRRWNYSIRFTNKLLYFVNHKVKYTNLERANHFKKGVILVNHSTMFEPLITSTSRNWVIRWITKKENKEKFFSRILSEISGALFIDREDSKTASLVLLKAKRIIDKGGIIGICPEGTRSRKKELLPFKKDIFKFIKLLNTDILVVTVSNCYKAFEKNPNKDVLDCKFVKHITPKHISKMTDEELEKKVRKLMINSLE